MRLVRAFSKEEMEYDMYSKQVGLFLSLSLSIVVDCCRLGRSLIQMYMCCIMVIRCIELYISALFMCSESLHRDPSVASIVSVLQVDNVKNLSNKEAWMRSTFYGIVGLVK